MTDPKPRHFPPPPAAPPPGLWRQVPPAIFPPLMGLWGLGLGWRLMGERLANPLIAGAAEALLGAVSLLFLFALVAWGSKPLRRPAVLGEELRVLPGQLGVPAAALGVMLMAAAMLPYAPGLSLVMVWAGLGMLAVVALGFLRHLITAPPPARSPSPAWHLAFVGYIIAPLTLLPLGWQGLSLALFAGAAVVAPALWLAGLGQFTQAVPPAPLRPLLAIHAAPAALLAMVAAPLGWPAMASAFLLAGLAFVGLLAICGRWLLGAGFSPLWGALTFPLAAMATATLTAMPGAAGLWLGAGLLLLASALNPFVAYQVLRGWAKGPLAQRTNAAIV